MWKIRYIYHHANCMYTAHVQKLGLTMSWFPLNNWSKKNHRFVSALLICAGKQENIEKFFKYITSNSENSERVSMQSMIHVRRVPLKTKYFDPLYNPQLIFTKPIIHKNGLEYTELCCWRKEPLTELLLARRHAKDTEVLELQSLRQEKIDDVQLLNVVPSLTKNQRELFQLAVAQGYYSHPRKITLGELAALRKSSKSTVHESLRRAESHLFETYAN